MKTNTSNEAERFFADAAKIEALLEKYKAFFDSDYLHQVRFEVESLKKKMSMDEEEANLLRIGVVGAMKAGKSTFLNMLLFEGKDFLPKASTPMTAALTRISYSSGNNRATIHYYTKDDWARIREYDGQYRAGLKRSWERYKKDVERRNSESARGAAFAGPGWTPPQPEKVMSIDQYENLRYCKDKGVSEFERSAHELVQGMEGSVAKDIGTKFGTKDVIDGADDLTALLSPYVGAEGQYTPIVNYVELEINHPELQGVEIVDMPGLGDPIVSRGRATKNFIKQCDAVLFLSTCSQFMTSQDMASLTTLLPSAGIQDGIVIASRFDGAMTGYLGKGMTLEQAYKKSYAEVESRYCEEIKKLPKSLRDAFEAHELQVVSSMADTLSRKRKTGDALAGDEPNVYRSLVKMNGGHDLTPEELSDISGLKSVMRELKKLKDNKAEILTKSNEQSVFVARNAVLQQLAQLLESVQIATRALRQQDVEGVRAKKKKMESALDRAATTIGSHFTAASLDAAKKIQDLETSLLAMRKNFSSLEVTIENRQKHETVRTGLFGWRHEVYTFNVKSFSVETAQIECQLIDYAAACSKNVSHVFDFLVDTDGLKRSVTDTVLTALGEEDFDQEDVLTPLRVMFAKIKLPSVKVDPHDFIDEVHNQYPKGVATGSDIHQAKQLLSTLLTDVQSGIAEQLKTCSKEIQDVLTAQASGFVVSLRNRMGGELGRIEAECADKEKNLKERMMFIDELHKMQGAMTNEV